MYFKLILFTISLSLGALYTTDLSQLKKEKISLDNKEHNKMITILENINYSEKRKIAGEKD